MKPLLLIDVDGVLNPYGSVNPKGFTLHTIDRFKVWLNPDHGPMLLSLQDKFDLVWGTTWENDANIHIAPIIGLPTLPFVTFPYNNDEDGDWLSWKMAGITKSNMLAGKSFAWIDDNLHQDAHDWSEQRNIDGIPTLFLWIDPRMGLMQHHIDKLRNWEL